MSHSFRDYINFGLKFIPGTIPHAGREKVLKLRRKYEEHLVKFETLGGKITAKYPVLYDDQEQAASLLGHYFHQDLLVASLIHKNNPKRHIDIGSRVDGFVAHVASFRKIEVMDVRDLRNIGHENISFIKADLMDSQNAPVHITDSISCLHAIEHFGLGRYGDPLDPNGHIKGFNNIVQMLSPGGNLYISFPIGKSNEVWFNAHRVFHPNDIFTWSAGETQLRLERFDYIDDQSDLHQNIRLTEAGISVTHGCGIYTFRKLDRS